MTLATCLVCGMRTDPGVACTGCGTPVPAEPRGAADMSGQRKYWESIQDKLTRATAPKYQVIGLVGYGGMAGVFAADEPRLGRRVAMKVLSPALMIDARLVERFMQEARTIAQLNHPSIVAIHDVDESDGLHWFTMTYLPGRTLGEVMGENVEPIAVSVACAWLHQIGSALGFAHAHGIVHRDIKPRNVLLDILGNAVVTDFGIAKLADIDQGLTRTGLLIGTPAYMSPEQCSGEPATAASDQYSLGAVLYQLLTGMTPFTGPTLAVLQAHVREPPRPIRELRPDCPDELAGSVHRMLEKRPEDRWPSLAPALTAAGATPPGFDDPVRIRIEELAASVTTLTVVPQPARLSEGTRERVRVTVEDRAGRPIGGRRIDWRSSQPAVAIIAGDELLALSPGSTALTASCGVASRSFDVAVEADPVGAVEVKPTSAVLHSGAQLRLAAAVADLDGSRLEGRALLWSTSDPAVARVSAAGVVTGVAPGDVTITARSGGKYAASSLSVTPRPPMAAATAREPIRVAPRAPALAVPRASASEGFAAAKQSYRTWEQTATRAWRRLAVAIAGSATRVRRGTMAAVASSGRLAAGVARDASRTSRRAIAALTSTGNRAASAASGATRSSSRAMLALARTRRRAATIAGAVAILAVTMVLVSRWISTGGVGGQTGLAPPVEPAPTPPAGVGEEEPTVAEPGTPLPDTQQAPVDTVPAAPAPVATAWIVVAGELPDGASVVLSDGAGRTWPLSEQRVHVPPGRYTIDFHAPGYESEREAIVLVSGRLERWTPELRPVRAPEAAPPPTRVSEEDRTAILDAIRPFVAAFDRRDPDVVLAALPPSEHPRWRRVLESDEITDFSATLSAASPVRPEGARASVSFTVTVSYRDQGEPQGSHVTYYAYTERRDAGWRLYRLEYVSIQDF